MDEPSTAAAQSGAPVVLGVVGQPDVAARSLSPVMHGAAIAKLGLNAYYVPLAVRERAIRKALRGLPRLGFRGVNVTMPYKPVAAEVADTRSDVVERSGVANTLVIDEHGRIHAESTDGLGVVEAIRARGSSLEGAEIVLIGAGGAATEVAHALCAAGAGRLHLWNRTLERAEQLAETLQRVFPAQGIEVHTDVPIHVPAHVLASAIPHEAAAELELTGIRPETLVVDLAYRTDRQPTALVEAAQIRGAACVDGREVLVRQGAASFRLWFGIEPPTEVMHSAVR